MLGLDGEPRILLEIRDADAVEQLPQFVTFFSVE